MRSHAKASTAGSNLSRGSRLALALTAAVTLVLSLTPALASAALPKHSFLEPFGSANEPTFSAPEGMAVDQSTGDLLVIDKEAGTLSRYHADGTPANFSALGSNEITGFSFGESGEVQVAVDNSGGPTDGNIYVAQGAGAETLKIYASDGSELPPLTEYKEGANASGPLIELEEPCGVAVDPSGNVYVGDFSGAIHKYEPAANPPVNNDNTANFPFAANCTLAAGAGPTEGFIFAAHFNAGLVKLDSSTGQEKYEVDTGFNKTLSVDPATGHLYVAKAFEEEVLEYDVSGGSSASEVSKISLASVPQGVAIDETSGNVYINREGNAEVDVYGPLTIPPFTTRPPLGFSPIDGSGTGVTLHLPSGIAVDETSGNVFLNDGTGGNVVDIFGAEGGVPSGLASPYQLGGFQFNDEPSGAAVDNSATSPSKGTLYVVDVQASNSPRGKIKKYTRNGGTELYELAGELNPTSGPGWSEPLGVAVDTKGNVFVADWFSRSVVEFSPTGTQLARIGTAASVDHPSGVAVDAAGDLFVQGYGATGIGPLYKYPANGSGEVEEGVFTEVLATGATGVAVDPATNALFVGLGDHVTQYDATTLGKELEFGFGTLSQTTRIAVNSATDRVYVSDRGKNNVAVFGAVTPEGADPITGTTATLHATVNPGSEQLTDCHFEYGLTTSYGNSAPCVPPAASIPPDSSEHEVTAQISGLIPTRTYHFRFVTATAAGTSEGPDRTFITFGDPPTVSAQSVENVGFSDATVTAKINPGGVPTTYHVEYGATASYGQSTPESLPIGFEGDKSEHTVSVHIGGLALGTAYHFRFVASNGGSGEGADATFATYRPTPTFGLCPNDGFRSGLGARLPDCRAYEQATPIDKHGANIQGTVEDIQASSAGDRIIFYLNGGLPDSVGSSTLSAYMASRGAAAWSSVGLLPATDPGQSAAVFGWSEDLSTVLDEAPGPGNIGEALYLRDSASGTFQVGPSADPSLRDPWLAGFAAADSHLTFESRVSLLPGAVAGKTNLYELNHGNLTLPGRVPAGAATSCDDEAGPACVPAPEGSFAGSYNCCQAISPGTATGGASAEYYTQNTISRDGSKVFFTAGGSGQLYVREDGTTTTQVSASQRSTPDPNGHKPAAFLAATPDGSEAFFSSCEKLTDDSTAVSTSANSCISASQGSDLYSYDTNTGQLTDLSVDSNGDPKGADVQGVLGTSQDGSYVYFAAGGALAPGASLTTCGNEKSSDTCNIYLSHGGSTTFIAALRSSDEKDWASTTGGNGNPESPKGSRVSADGRTLLFRSVQSLTGSDDKGFAELFRYSAPSGQLNCVSCNPTGASSSGAVLGTEIAYFNHIAPNFKFLTRNLSTDGDRVFFDSKDALVTSDVNGVTDVYEWEAKGSGSCESESQNGGCLYLISSGTSPAPSYFADASSNGDDVFIFTSQPLVPSDGDELVDIYDASVEGGLPSQHPLSPPTCNSTACQSNPPPPPEQTPASASFSGPGNVHEGQASQRCPKGKRKVRKAGKVRCQKAHKQHKRHNNRGGSK